MEKSRSYTTEDLHTATREMLASVGLSMRATSTKV